MIKFFIKNYLLFASTFFIIYLLFNLFGGDRGLISYLNKSSKIKELEVIENNLKNNVIKLEKKNSIISNKIDLDYIEILIRDKFMYGKKGEKVYIIIENEN
tara:strand:- start:532 stop:834 length:303 start_codon:yes stop_codon:yes gene_type:complete